MRGKEHSSSTQRATPKRDGFGKRGLHSSNWAALGELPQLFCKGRKWQRETPAWSRAGRRATAACKGRLGKKECRKVAAMQSEKVGENTCIGTGGPKGCCLLTYAITVGF